MGGNVLGDVAFELAVRVEEDSWFTSQDIFPNVDFWVALIFNTLDFPADMMPVWTFIPRYVNLMKGIRDGFTSS
jgi:citrate synthase